MQETSKEEALLVSEWLKTDRENQKAYEDFIRIWFHSERSAELNKVNHQLAWKKITSETAIKKPKSFSIYYRIASAAAVLLLVLILTIKLTPTQLVAYNETRGSVKEVLLPDSSKVFLNYMGKIEYPSHFPKKNREVKLAGHAYFEVQRDTERQFTIETSQSHINVLGTSFDCFATDSSTTVFVNTGKVSLVNISDTNQYAVLLPGDLGESNQQVVSKKKSSDENILSWKTGVYKFQNTPLNDVFVKLEERHHLSFKFNIEDIKYKVITVSFNNDSLENILEVIQHTCNVSFVYETNSIIVNAYPKN